MKTSLPFAHYPIILCILLSTITTNQISCMGSAPPTSPPTSEYITNSCQTTLYPHLCTTTLAKHATEINSKPKLLAITALIATFNTTRSTSKVLAHLSKNLGLKLGERAALSECVEVVSDSLDELQKSIKELSRSQKGRTGFEFQMSNVQTWVSASLTDFGTCTDDFATEGETKNLVRRVVGTSASLTSISLAFINNYAAV